MNRLADITTAGLSRASDILFVQNPKGTSFGVFLGVVVDGIVKLAAPLFKRYETWVDIGRLNVVHCIAAGVVLLNITHIFRRRQLPNSVEDAFEAIRLLKKSGASPVQVKLQLLALCSIVVERVKLESEAVDPGKADRGFLRGRF